MTRDGLLAQLAGLRQARVGMPWLLRHQGADRTQELA